jgi:hypothetical protein
LSKVKARHLSLKARHLSLGTYTFYLLTLDPWILYSPFPQPLKFLKFPLTSNSKFKRIKV